jgi:hypothetical protein
VKGYMWAGVNNKMSSNAGTPVTSQYATITQV